MTVYDRVVHFRLSIFLGGRVSRVFLVHVVFSRPKARRKVAWLRKPGRAESANRQPASFIQLQTTQILVACFLNDKFPSANFKAL